MRNFKVNRGVALGLALVAGLLLTIQVGFNTTFGKQVGNPLASSLVSFSTGFLVLGAINLLHLLGRAEWSGLKRAPKWVFFSGFVGGFYVTSTIIVAPSVGLAAMSATVVAGQLIGSLIVDKLGALGFEKKIIGLWQWLGALLLPVATLLILGLADGDKAVQSNGNYWLLLLSFTAGLALSMSAGINATIARYVRNPGASALVNFAGGVVFILLIIAIAFSTGLASIDTANLGANLAATPWWGWLGGTMGATYVVVVTIVAPHIGAAMTNVLTVAGQLIMSLTADTIGLFRADSHSLTVFRVAGVVLLVGVVLLIKSAKPLHKSKANMVIQSSSSRGG